MITYLPEWVANSAVPLHRYSQGEVDGPGEPHLGHWQEQGDHAQVGGVGPQGGKETGHTEDGDGQNNVDEVESSKGQHEVVEVLEDDLAGEPDDTDSVPNNSKAPNNQLK